jgi:hypothetical protein
MKSLTQRRSDCAQPVQTIPAAPGPIAPGGAVSVQAIASCDAAEQPEFRLRYRLKGNKAWAKVRQWGGPNFTWSTTGLAIYELRVETRAIGFSPGVQTAQKLDYAVGDVCTDATMQALDPTPQAIGDVADFQASATCPPGKTPELQYRVRRAGQIDSTVERDWAPNGNFSWDTTSEPAGVHRVQSPRTRGSKHFRVRGETRERPRARRLRANALPRCLRDNLQCRDPWCVGTSRRRGLGRGRPGDLCTDPLRNAPHAGLYVNLGGVLTFIGATPTSFAVTTPATLALGVNDCVARPNAGFFSARVSIVSP